MNRPDSNSEQTSSLSLLARTAMVLVGLFALGASIALYVRADAGADPFTVLALGAALTGPIAEATMRMMRAACIRLNSN